MRPSAWHRAAEALLVLGVIAGPLAVHAYQGPRLSATYTVSEARPMPGGVGVSFAFALENLESTETIVDRVDLGSLSDGESPYATFEGGTLSGRGKLRGSAQATVPQSLFDRWQGGGPATLYVYTRTDRGDVHRLRVNARRLSAAR